MGREELLGELIVRLSFFAEGDGVTLNNLLKDLRSALKSNVDDQDLRQLSVKLTNALIKQSEINPAINKPQLGDAAVELSGCIKSLQVSKTHRKQIHELADQLVTNTALDIQLDLLKKVFTLLSSEIADKTPAKKSSLGAKSWFGKKSANDPERQAFLEKSAKLLNKVLSHIEALSGDLTETKALREQLEQSLTDHSVSEVMDEVLSILETLGKERLATQNVLGDLREKLHSVEEIISSMVTDSDDSIERAELLEKNISHDVEVIAESDKDDLEQLKRLVEERIVNLSTKVANYLALEKDRHHDGKKKIKNLTRKVHEMEVRTSGLLNEIQAKTALALKDPLTRVYNRAGYEERITEEFARCARTNMPLSLVFVDCNKFKDINDMFGHKAGDIVLVSVAKTLKGRARISDVVARYGGDEFVVILPDTPLEAAKTFATNACKEILNAGFNNNGDPLDVSISCGVTEVRRDDTPSTAIERADQAMYEAKKQANPKVVVT